MKLTLMTRLAAGGLLGRSAGMINAERAHQQLYGQSRRRRCFIDLVPIPSRRRHMVTTTVTRRRTTELEPSGQAAPAAAADEREPRWMVLDRWCCHHRDDSTAADDRTTAAECRTSWGRHLRVSLARAAPPAISTICFNRDALSASYEDTLDVVAAHGDCVLLKMSVPCSRRPRLGICITDVATDYFLYRRTAAAATAGGLPPPPSLSLLPACHISMYGLECGDDGDLVYMDRVFDVMDTGILRCGGGGGGEVLVAQLQVTPEAPFDTAKLCVLRPGRHDWELKEAVPIVHNNDEVGSERRHDLGLEKWQQLNAAVPAGNRFLCWVNYDRSILLVCDMAAVAAAENPKLRYVPLPVKAVPLPPTVKPLPWQYYRSIGAAAVPTAAELRFVSIDNRCCCGAPLVESFCERSSSAFVVTTWTMALNTTGEPMEWVKDGVLHCEELWAAVQDAGAGGHEGVPLPPRVVVSCPIVSSENPDVVCFMAEDDIMDCEMNTESWTIEVDMRRKTLISVVSGIRSYAHPIQWDVCVNQDKSCVDVPALPAD